MTTPTITFPMSDDLELSEWFYQNRDAVASSYLDMSPMEWEQGEAAVRKGGHPPVTIFGQCCIAALGTRSKITVDTILLTAGSSAKLPDGRYRYRLVIPSCGDFIVAAGIRTKDATATVVWKPSDSDEMIPFGDLRVIPFAAWWDKTIYVETEHIYDTMTIVVPVGIIHDRELRTQFHNTRWRLGDSGFAVAKGLIVRVLTM